MRPTQTAMAELSRLLKIISLLYRMTDEDIDDLTTDLLSARQREWRNAIQEEITGVGCASATVHGPSGVDLSTLRSDSRKEARGIAKTWNRDVERQLVKLYNANPRGNRGYYGANMERWVNARAQWKNPQIALNVAQSTRQYAKSRFWKQNKLTKEARYILTGPPPVCDTCTMLFARGLVTISVVERYKAPIHVNCPHEWELFTGVGVGRLNCDTLWTG